MTTIGSLCSGIGGIEKGLIEICGLGPVRWHCEKDAAARAVLRHHWPEVPCYEDVRDIDASAPAVDLICGGFPCQPHSVAGKKQGTADARWLWPEFARVIAALRPRAVFIENVPGLRTSGLRDVLADLARLGLDAEWGLFSAAQVGAPHRRNRLFLLAHAPGAGLEGLSRPRTEAGLGRLSPGESRALDVGHPHRGAGTEPHLLADAVSDGRAGARQPPGSAGGGSDVADADRVQLRDEPGRGGRQGGAGAAVTQLDGQALADADRGGRAQFGLAQPPRIEGEAGGLADRRGDAGYVHRFPPGPDRIAEWDGPEPAVRRLHAGLPRGLDGRLSRPTQLRLLGNSCSPQQAAFAFLSLCEQAGLAVAA